MTGRLTEVEARLEIRRRRICVPNLDGLYTEVTDPARLAVHDELSHEEQESLELEADSFQRTGYAARLGGREFFFAPQDYESMSRRRINNLRKTIERERPEWVTAIREAARASNNIYIIIGLADLSKHPYPAVAIIENLRERGELPEEED